MFKKLVLIFQKCIHSPLIKADSLFHYFFPLWKYLEFIITYYIKSLEKVQVKFNFSNNFLRIHFAHSEKHPLEMKWNKKCFSLKLYF